MCSVQCSTAPLQHHQSIETGVYENLDFAGKYEIWQAWKSGTFKFYDGFCLLIAIKRLD